MKRNTYVTAALFVVFGLLTVAYWQMDSPADEQIPIAATLRTSEDVAANADVADGDEAGIDAEDAEDVDVLADDLECEEDCEDAEVMADALECEEDCEEADETSREVISTLDALRADMESGRAQQVSALTDIIAGADFDPQTKSAAKDSLNELQSLANSSRMLEIVIGHMGFEDVLVRATADFVQVTVQVSSLDDVPTREELAELYVLAGIEFGSHRNGNISIDFQPLN